MYLVEKINVQLCSSFKWDPVWKRVTSWTSTRQKNIPLANWCWLISQPKKLSMMCLCHFNPTLLTDAAVKLYYHFDATPMAASIKVFFRVNPVKWTPWGIKSLNEGYVRISIDYYYCYMVALRKNKPQWISGTVKLQHHTITVSSIMTADNIIRTTKESTSELHTHTYETLLDQFKAIQPLRDVIVQPTLWKIETKQL